MTVLPIHILICAVAQSIFRLHLH